MYDQLKLILKRKYALVHVPNRHKVARWVDQTREYHRHGESPEQAGLRAAKQIFPYEYKEQTIYSEMPVSEILELAAGIDKESP